jgi:hypothetical protein
MKNILLTGVNLFYVIIASGQMLNGNTGLLNIPSADMQRDGTFFWGANYLPEQLTPETFNYPTLNYFFNITFLPFLEFNYRLTLLKMEGGNFNQDRSFGMRLQLIQEKPFFPALVLGGTDLYSSSGKQSGFFNSVYAVASKNFYMNKTRFHISTGYAHQGIGKIKNENLKGIFGGFEVSPGFLPSLRFIGEYDSNVINVGAGFFLFNHLSVFGLLHNIRYPAGGIAYFIYL